MEPTAPGPAVALRTQAAACAELGSPMYAELLRRSADDVEAGGPVARVLAGHEHDPGPSALGLRLLGSVHRLVLERRAGALAAYYPSVGGTWKAEGGWRAFTALLAEQPDAVREWLDRAPQTNEVGRAPVLYGGLLHLARDLPLRLLEIGASAGLNLRVDRFAYLDEDGRRFGAATDDLVLTEAWRGRRLEPWPGMRIVERLGSDLAPVDPASNDGRMLLTAYVWPDQRQRLERLRAALRVAAVAPVEVRRQDARSFVDGLELADGTTTVLWHSVMWQYLPRADQEAVAARLDRLGATATDGRRFALRAEPSRRTPDGDHEFLVRLGTWPGGEQRVIGSTVAHGVPTTWECHHDRGARASIPGRRESTGMGPWSCIPPDPPQPPGGPMTDNDDIKAKMRAALERKQANDRGVDDNGHKKEKGHGPDTHGPLGGVHMHRRKSGGGGA